MYGRSYPSRGGSLRPVARGQWFRRAGHACANTLLPVVLALWAICCQARSPVEPIVVQEPTRLLEVLTQARVYADTGEQVRAVSVWVENLEEAALLTRAPARVVFRLRLKRAFVLETAIALDRRAWSQPGDGVTFFVAIKGEDLFEYLFANFSNPYSIEQDRRWLPVEIDLSAYQEKDIELILGADPGPQEDASGDLGLWKDPILWNPILDVRPVRREAAGQPVSSETRLLDLLDTARQYPHLPTRPNDYIRLENVDMGQGSVAALYEHPTSQVIFALHLIHPFVFDTAVGLLPEAWDKSDGVTFLAVVSEGTHTKTLVERHIEPRRNQAERGWVPIRVDLTGYQGKTVKLLLGTQPGPANQAAHDWAVWKDPRLVPVQAASRR